MPSHLSSWVDHCKQYAKENGIKYSECLKNDNCRKMYHGQKASSKLPQPQTEMELASVKLKSNGKRKSK